MTEAERPTEQYAQYVGQIVRDYATMEPDESDTWNPVGSDTELEYRLSFLFGLTKCLELCDIPLTQLRVLDIGCGTGRSTRLYIDLGLRPDQLMGLDVRPGTVALAKRLNPAISFQTYDGRAIGFPSGSFNWIQLGTVFSSIADHGHRAHVAAQAMAQLRSGGYLCYLDRWRANEFAGGDVLQPEALFAPLRTVWASPLRAHQCFPTIRHPWLFLRRHRTPLGQLRAWLAFRTRWERLVYPSHYVMLAQKP